MGTGIQTKTLILVATAAILGGSLYLFQQKLPPPASEQAVTSAKPVFNLQESQITGLVLKQGEQTLKLERDDQGAWQILEPVAARAETGTVVFLLNLIATAKTEKSLTVPLQTADEFGLAEPIATIEISTLAQGSHRLVLGGLTFDRNQLYAQADPPIIPTDPLTIIVVPLQFLDAINKPLQAWKAQPTPTPPASPSPP
ncbi:hypothetical protein [Synechococcus sp. PCC 6312]|uniref:hypothetical protein n=1 Tax=Synechococcus sp. (strain ATCC 27167 / PCC 6312) TaxID=195253 RepID=UPI00029F257F|nr:hypothetical protein [Synechococcus sp. PCC 6312]AFY59630.1 hypothetical protein Syn6312_0399 [Synechococcus sp. PCC 6312]